MLEEQHLKDTFAELATWLYGKNVAYGDAHNRACNIIKVLYPDGIQPEQYESALTVVRMLDKLFRLASKELPEEDRTEAWKDLAGYALLRYAYRTTDTDSDSEPIPYALAPKIKGTDVKPYTVSGFSLDKMYLFECFARMLGGQCAEEAYEEGEAYTLDAFVEYWFDNIAHMPTIKDSRINRAVVFPTISRDRNLIKDYTDAVIGLLNIGAAKLAEDSILGVLEFVRATAPLRSQRIYYGDTYADIVSDSYYVKGTPEHVRFLVKIFSVYLNRTKELHKDTSLQSFIESWDSRATRDEKLRSVVLGILDKDRLQDMTHFRSMDASKARLLKEFLEAVLGLNEYQTEILRTLRLQILGEILPIVGLDTAPNVSPINGATNA